MDYTNSGSDEMIIPVHKGKTAALAFGALVFVLIGIFMASLGAKGGAFYALIGGASVVVFGVAFVYLLSRLFSSAPALVINARGITDNATAVGAGFVAWNEIDSAHIGTTEGKRFVCIVPRDVPGFLARQPAWKRGAMKVNVGLVGAPITIAGSMMSMPLEELLSRVTEHLQRTAPEPLPRS